MMGAADGIALQDLLAGMLHGLNRLSKDVVVVQNGEEDCRAGHTHSVSPTWAFWQNFLCGLKSHLCICAARRRVATLLEPVLVQLPTLNSCSHKRHRDSRLCGAYHTALGFVAHSDLLATPLKKGAKTGPVGAGLGHTGACL
jgi:hypothetical protein